jgi:hypothetical protein
MLLLMSFALTILPYRRLAPILPSCKTPPPRRLARRLEAAILRASRSIPRTTCLAEACTVRLLLALRGYGATMRIGVKALPDGKGFVAHAWLVDRNDVILGARVPDFSTYHRLIDYS